MRYFKDIDIKTSLSILIGLSLMSISLVSANDLTDASASETSDQQLSRMAAEKAGKVARVEALVQTWLQDSRESKETLFQAFYALSDTQLTNLEAADNYNSVRAIAFGQGLTLAAKGTLAKLGDNAEDLVYTPVSPCRIYSSRDLPGGADPFTDNTTRSIFSYGSSSTITAQGGDTAGCASPRGTDPSAVHININVIPVVTNPPVNNGKGTVKVAPKGEAATTKTVLVKFNAGTNSSNAATVKTCRGCSEEIDVRTTGNNVHVILEVLGYYYPVDKDDSDRLALAFGYVRTDGTLVSGSENVSSAWNASANRYEITITGENYFFNKYTSLVTISGCQDVVPDTDSVGGKLLIKFFDVEGSDAGTKKQCDFQFVTFKDQ